MISDWWIYILLGVIVFLESLRPNRGYGNFSAEKKQNLLWYFINEILLIGIISAVAAFIGEVSHSSLHSIGIASVALDGPFLSQVLIFIILFDFINYWVHRLLHSIPFLWKLHKLHHSSQELTALSAFRVSPLELIIHATVLNLLVSMVGFSPLVRGLGNFLFFFACLVQHANISLLLPRWVGFIFVTPRNHRWHHSSQLYKKNGQNFGFIFSFWDRIFATYHNPQECSDEFGLQEGEFPVGIMSRFLYPLKVDYFNKNE